MDIALAVHVGIMKINLYADETVLTNCVDHLCISCLWKIVQLINFGLATSPEKNLLCLISFKMYLISDPLSVWSDIVFSH